jgi:hypothetical protein
MESRTNTRYKTAIDCGWIMRIADGVVRVAPEDSCV